MTKDPIVKEIHKIRAEYAKRFGNDLKAIAADIQAKQGKDGRKLVKPAPRLISKKRRRGATA